MFSADWLGYGILIGVILVIIFIFLLLRRTLLSYREGYRKGQR